MAGLQILDAGYRRFRVAPRPGGGISAARTHHDSPHGRIAIAWERNQDDHGSSEVSVPPGTEAELVLPDGTTDTLSSGRHQRTWSAQ